MAATKSWSGVAESAHPSEETNLDEAVRTVRAKATEFARLSVREKADLLRSLPARFAEVGPAWVEAGCRAKGIALGTPLEGEEWIAGVSTTTRNARLLGESLAAIAQRGRPPFGCGTRARDDGRVEVDVFPPNTMEGMMFSGFRAYALLQESVSEATARARQASFYQKLNPEGRVSAILGAGNVASIPPGDVLTKMFQEGHVCVLKMNPVNEWVGPSLERAMAPLIERGYLRIVYGGGQAGAYLVNHPEVDDIHITGSDKTHDLIVWGPPGPERERRKAAGDPVLKKTISSELGNVSPVAFVPGTYTDEELWFQARSVASMVANNGSFNCNAGKMLVVAKGWSQREKLTSLVKRALAEVPPRKAYYPGAFDRYEALLSGRDNVQKIGAPRDGELPWAYVNGIDIKDANEALFVTEPFCAILSEVQLDESDPVAFLDAMTRFCNDRLWGTLNAAITITPRDERDPAIAKALDRALLDLRYGTVALNQWPALGYGLMTTPWGGHPSATLANVQSGIGWIHNTFLLEGVEKVVVRGPIVAKPKPVWFYDNRQMAAVGRKLTTLEAGPSWLKLPSLVFSALRG
jgi:aldehyde dehydrogenase (NAD(P)+)